MTALLTLSVALVVSLTALLAGAKAGVPEEIRHYFDDFEAAIKVRDAERMAHFFTENTVFVSNNTVAVGRKLSSASGAASSKTAGSLSSLDAVEPHGEADFAVAVGTFEADGILHESGPFSKLLRKENGRWLSDLHRCTVYRHP